MQQQTFTSMHGVCHAKLLHYVPIIPLHGWGPNSHETSLILAHTNLSHRGIPLHGKSPGESCSILSCMESIRFQRTGQLASRSLKTRATQNSCTALGGKTVRKSPFTSVKCKKFPRTWRENLINWTITQGHSPSENLASTWRRHGKMPMRFRAKLLDITCITHLSREYCCISGRGKIPLLVCGRGEGIASNSFLSTPFLSLVKKVGLTSRPPARLSHSHVVG